MESEIGAVAIGTTTTSARNMQVAIDGLCVQVEAQLTQNRANLAHKYAETQGTVQKILANLEELTR